VTLPPVNTSLHRALGQAETTVVKLAVMASGSAAQAGFPTMGFSALSR
jgi:hypothetical protein